MRHWDRIEKNRMQLFILTFMHPSTPTTKSSIQARLSLAGLIIIIVYLGQNVFAYFYTRQQLLSPLIPQSTFDEVACPLLHGAYLLFTFNAIVHFSQVWQILCFYHAVFAHHHFHYLFSGFLDINQAVADTSIVITIDKNGLQMLQVEVSDPGYIKKSTTLIFGR